MADAKAYVANGTIRTARFVKVDPSDNNSVLEADANERILGVSQMGGRTAPIPDVVTDPVEAAQTGEHLLVHLQGEYALLEIGSGGCTAGDLLKSDADGKGVALDESAGSKEEAGARSLATCAEGDFAPVQIQSQTVTTET